MKLPVSENQLYTNLEKAYDVVIGEEESSIILTFLRDNIYDDPKKAIVREVLSNAVDVHVENNVQRPIEISLPNAFTNNLTFRDFGTGLSKEFMTTKYVRAGCSTKRETNLTLGGYGIGRLSPLSYSDVYYVNSFVEGIESRYVVSVYDDDFGRKKVSLLHVGDFPTEEPSGLKIVIPIKEKDIGSFKSIVYEHCRYLHNQTPLVDGQVPYTVEKELEAPDGSWYVTKQSHYGGSGITFLIGGMPNFIRNIGEYVEKSVGSRYGLIDSYQYLVYSNLVVNVPIGSVTQTASKDIQKSDLTAKTLTDLILKANTELIQAYQEKLDRCNHLDEACRLAAGFSKKDMLSWREVKFTKYSNIVLENCKISTIERNRAYNLTIKNLEVLPVIYKVQAYIKDIKGLSAEDIYLLLNKSTDIYLITPLEGFDNSKYNFIYLSEVIPQEEVTAKVKLKKQTPKKKVNKDEISVYYLRPDPSLQIACSTNKIRVAKEPIQPTYYLALNEETTKAIRSNPNYFKLASDYKVYLVEDTSKLIGANWINFDDFIQEQIAELTQQVDNLLDFAYLFETFYSQYSDINRFGCQLIDSDLKTFVLKFKAVSKYYLDLRDRQKKFILFALKNRNSSDNVFEKEYSALTKKYPLLLKWDSCIYHLTETEINTYINQVNNYATI